MIQKHIITAAMLLGLSACSPNSATSPKIDTSETVSLRVTSDIKMPAVSDKVSFIPNNVATWLGYIIAMDAKGDIYATTTQGSPAKIVASGAFIDILGVGIPNQPGIILALTQDYKLQAFMESDDEGNFKAVPLSGTLPDVILFCSGSSSFLAGDGKIYSLEVNIKDGSAVEVQSLPLRKAPKGTKSCTASRESRELTTLSNIDAQTIGSDGVKAYIGRDSLKRLVLKDGLTIAGSKNIKAITSTDVPMGSTFNGGLIVASDADTNRLLLVSKEFAKRVLAETGATP